MTSYILNTDLNSGNVVVNDKRIITVACKEFEWMIGQSLDSIIEYLKKDNKFKGIEKIKGGDILIK